MLNDLEKLNNDEENQGDENGNDNNNDRSWDTHRDRHIGQDRTEREERGHFDATGDQLAKEIKESIKLKENNLNLLFKDPEKKLRDNILTTRKDLDFNLNKDHYNYSKLNAAEKSMAWACEQMGKMQEIIPESNTKDMINGSCKMAENYIEMRLWNHKEPGWDKFFHCMGNCEASEHDVAGTFSAEIISNLREAIWNDSDSPADQVINRIGRENAGRCYDVCKGQIPKSYLSNLP